MALCVIPTWGGGAVNQTFPNVPLSLPVLQCDSKKDYFMAKLSLFLEIRIKESETNGYFNQALSPKNNFGRKE